MLISSWLKVCNLSVWVVVRRQVLATVQCFTNTGGTSKRNYYHNYAFEMPTVYYNKNISIHLVSQSLEIFEAALLTLLADVAGNSKAQSSLVFLKLYVEDLRLLLKTKELEGVQA